MIKEIENHHPDGDILTVNPSDDKDRIKLTIKDRSTSEEWYMVIDPHDIIKAYHALKGEENDVTQ